MKTFRIYSETIGRPGSANYKPREDFGTVRAETAMRALDAVAAKIGARHLPRTHHIAVMGIGYVRVEEIS